MKRFALILILLLASLFSGLRPGVCGDLSVAVNRMQYNASDPGITISADIPQIKLSWDLTPTWSLIGSFEQTRLALVGQQVFDIQIYSLGIGYAYPISRIAKLSIGASYYYPNWIEGHASNEGMYLYMRSTVGEEGPSFDDYRVDTQGAVGLVCAVSATIYKNVNVEVGYRWLMLPYNMYGENDREYWTLDRQLDAGGYWFGIQIVY